MFLYEISIHSRLVCLLERVFHYPLPYFWTILTRNSLSNQLLQLNLQYISHQTQNRENIGYIHP